MVGLGGFETLIRTTFRRHAPAGRDRAGSRCQSRHHLHGRTIRALDFSTRLKVRTDLVRIWQSEKKTILFVRTTSKKQCTGGSRSDHDGAARYHQDVVDVDLPRPRPSIRPVILKNATAFFN